MNKIAYANMSLSKLHHPNFYKYDKIKADMPISFVLDSIPFL